MQYQPFLIAPFKSGLNTDAAPWMLPADAFSTMENVFIKDGIIHKRGGIQFFVQFADNVGVTTNQITGIYNYTGLSAGEKVTELLFTDTVRMCRYNTTTEVCDAIDVADIFASSNYKWFANFGITGSVTQNRLFITDNNNSALATTPMRTYTFGAAATSDFLPKYGALASDVVRTCLMMFPLKNRLVLLNTVEDSGTALRKPQRARWCTAGDPSTTSDQWRQDIPGNGGFVDAPTSDFIIGAAALQDYLIVFFSNSTWSLRPTSNPALPFRWDRINNIRACDATFSVLSHDRYAISFGRTGIVACDGIELKRIDNQIQNFAIETAHQDTFDKIYSGRDLSLRRSWSLFKSAATSGPQNDSVLVRSEEEGSWSIYNATMSCVGTGNAVKDWALADFTGDNEFAFEDFGESETFLSFYDQKDANIFLGGDYSGRIYTLEFGTSDDTSTDSNLTISMDIVSAGLNPYKDEGVEAQLGYVDLYVNRSDKGQLTISFLQDDNATSFSSETINLIPEMGWMADVLSVALTNPCRVTAISHGITTGTEVFLYGVEGTVEVNTGPFVVTYVDENNFDLQGVDATGYTAYTSGGIVVDTPIAYGNERVWKRAYSGAIGYLHQIEISNEDKQSDISIHAIKPWFRKVGSRQLS